MPNEGYSDILTLRWILWGLIPWMIEVAVILSALLYLPPPDATRPLFCAIVSAVV